MAMDDLYKALSMFGDGVQQLQTSRAIASANDQVQQIHASEASEQAKRAQLQQIANGLTAHLAGMGTPATTLQALQGAIGPKQYANANDMNKDALLTGNKQLGDMASDQQEFENDKAFQLAQMKLQAKLNNQSPLAQEKLTETQDSHTAQMNKNYWDNINAAHASSRTMFGQWASTDGRGDRLKAVLGDPSSWKSMTSQQLGLLTDGLVQMTKGGVATKEEQELLNPLMAKLQAAKGQTYLNGKPVGVDLSGFAGLYNNLIDREGSMAKEKMLDNVVNSINAGASIANRPRNQEQWARTTAAGLQQLGINVDPTGIKVDPKKGVVIPEIQGVLDDANNAPKAAAEAIRDARAGKPEALKFLQAHGLDPSMNPKDAGRILRSRIKSSLFQ